MLYEASISLLQKLNKDKKIRNQIFLQNLDENILKQYS